MSLTRTTPGLCAVLIALVLLAGCASNPSPAPLAAPPTSPATATPEKVMVAPTLPPAAQGTSRAAAVPFVRHWIETLNYAAETLDDGALRKLSSKDCGGCESALSIIRRVKGRGGDIRGMKWTPESLQLLSGTDDLAQINVLVDAAPSRIRESADGKYKRYNGGRTVLTFDLVQLPGDKGWEVARIRGVSN